MRANKSESLFSNLQLSWQANLLFSITTFIAFSSAFPGMQVQLETSLTLALGISAITAVFTALLSSLSRAVHLPKGPSATAFFGFQVVAVGVFRGLAFFYSVEWAGLEQPTPLPVRLLTSTINTGIWLTFSCALVAATIRYSHQFNNLFRALSMEIAKKPGFSGLSEIDGLDNMVALKKNLAGIHAQASASGITSDTLLAAGVAVRDQIENLIKPLSHRLWFNEKRNRPQIKVFGLIKDSLSNFTFRPLRFLLVFSALEFSAILNAYPLSRVIFGLALSSTLFLALTSTYKFMVSKFPSRLGVGTSMAFLFVMAILPVPLTDFLMPLFNQSRMLFPVSAATIVAPIAILVLLIVESCIALVEQDRRLVDRHFANQLEKSLDPSPSAFASYLHNSLQSELTGIAYRLEASAANPNSPESRQTLEILGSLINRSISQDFANFDETPLVRLERMVEAWEGIAEVTYDIDKQCAKEAQHLSIIVQIIEEATTNSVRYGGARHIHAKVARIGSTSRMEITTDASKGQNWAPGLGSQWLVEKTVFQSPLEFTETGTRQVIEI